MKKFFNLSPDAEQPTAGGKTTVIKEPKLEKHNSFIPRKLTDFTSVALAVNESWKKNNWLTLQYSTQKTYEKQLNDLIASSRKTQSGTSKVTTISADLKALDNTIADAIGENGLKLALKAKFKSKDVAQYPRYGIIKVGKRFTLPTDREKRLEAMRLIPQALTDDGLTTTEYGLAFWNKIIKDYEVALSAQQTNQTNISTGMSDKNPLEPKVRQVLKSILLILEGNYPDNFKDKCREWGYRKTGQ